MQAPTRIARCGMLCMLIAGRLCAAPIESSFIYQGQLKDGGMPANGNYDMRFSLYDAASSGVLAAGPLVFDGGPGNAAAVSVGNGLFSVELEFEDSFDGNAVWLHVDVRPHGTGSYTPLTPRQPLTPVPFALYALDGPGGAGPWTVAGANIHNTNAANVGIGTNNPAAPLHVMGDIRTDGDFGIAAYNPNDPTSVAALGWFNDVARIRIGGNGVGASAGLDIQKTGDRSLMRIYDSGDVWFRGGLDVTGNVGANGVDGVFARHPAGLEAAVHLSWYDDTARIRIGGNDYPAYNGLDIQAVGNRSLMRITNAGDVGIGTSDPANRLSVVGSANISSRLGVGLSNPLAPLHVGGGGDV